MQAPYSRTLADQLEWACATISDEIDAATLEESNVSATLISDYSPVHALTGNRFSTP